MKKILTALLLALFVLTSCAGPGAPTTGASASSSGEMEQSAPSGPAKRPVFVATLFPQYDFARHIAGEFADVILIVPPGVEPHSYEPTPQDIVTMSDAIAVFFTNEAMEPWMVKLADAIDSYKIDLSARVELRRGHHDHDHEHEHADHGHDHEHADADHDHEHEHADHDHDHDHGGVDPHYWLDPRNAVLMVEEICDTMTMMMPEYEVRLRARADELISVLRKLDETLEERTEHLAGRVIVSGGHFAFGYFADRYDLEAVSPFENFSPDAEPSPKKIAEIIDYVRKHGITAIYHEELIDPKIAATIAAETGVKMLRLHAAHNVSKDELAAGVTYVRIMLDNMENLEEGLGIR